MPISIHAGFWLSIWTLGLTACSLGTSKYAVEKRFNGSTWHYKDSLSLDLKQIQPEKGAHFSKLMLQLAVSEKYRYRNIHLLLQPMRTDGKGKPIEPMKIELQLSDPEGNWLGEYSILDKHYHFELTLLDSISSSDLSSVNSIRLRHAMRDDSLKGITAVKLSMTN
jgi:gliding motility-associated lipoprotein GldH